MKKLSFRFCNKLLSIKAKTAVILYLLFDIFCVGMGMGVPIFCILFGFPLGWYCAKRAVIISNEAVKQLKLVLYYAIITSAVTFVIMALIWGGSMVPRLLSPEGDFTNFGIPMILFKPKASFIGWLVLMVFISPFLQMLATIFGAHISFLFICKNNTLKPQ